MNIPKIDTGNTSENRVHPNPNRLPENHPAVLGMRRASARLLVNTQTNRLNFAKNTLQCFHLMSRQKDGRDVTFRCGQCNNCRKLIGYQRKRDALMNAVTHTATYMVTLTLPERTDIDTGNELFRELTRSISNGIRDQIPGYEPLRFFRVLELTKRQTPHFHMLLHATDLDPINIRQHWPYLSDIRLVCGTGYDLDGHITKQTAQYWSQEKRELRDQNVELTTKRQSPLKAINYVTKYIMKSQYLPGVEDLLAQKRDIENQYDQKPVSKLNEWKLKKATGRIRDRINELKGNHRTFYKSNGYSDPTQFWRQYFNNTDIDPSVLHRTNPELIRKDNTPTWTALTNTISEREFEHENIDIETLRSEFFPDE